MKANEDKNLEKFVAEIMKETSLEKPSADFTSKVMAQVLVTDMGKATVYKPLISKPAWTVIFTGIMLLMFYLLFKDNVQTAHWFDTIDFSLLNQKISKGLSAFKFSAITFYTVISLAVMLFLQIAFLKRYFNKRTTA